MIEPAQDNQLLRNYVEAHSESAFTELVDRHIDLVYSTALRKLRNPDLARDVAQQVFTDLARKANSLIDREVLAGWLHQATCFAAAKLRRTQQRRETREREAVAMAELTWGTSPDWTRIEPELDAAVAGLKLIDREAVLLRFFQNQDFRSLGEVLGLSEEAAKKRVARALRRLRMRLQGRGISLGETALATAIAAAGAPSVPAGVAATVALASLAAAAVPAAAGSTEIAVRIMSITKSQAGVIVAVGLLSIPLCLIWKQNRDLRRELSVLEEVAEQPSQPPKAAVPEGMALVEQGELNRLQNEQRELLQLRGQVALLRSELRELQVSQSTADAEENQTADTPEPDSVLFTAAITNRVKSGSTLVVGGWTAGELRRYLLITPTIRPLDAATVEEPLAVRSRVVAAPEEFWNGIGWESSEKRRSTLGGVLTPKETQTLVALLEASPVAELSNESEAAGNTGAYIGLGCSVDNESGAGMMMLIDVYPRILADSGEVELELIPSTVPADITVHDSLRSDHHLLQSSAIPH